MYKKYFIAIALLLTFGTLKAQLFINEFMSSNTGVIEDEDGDSSDWLELYNAGNEVITTQNYYLSDDENNLHKWQIPVIEMPAQSYLLIFCSDKNRQFSDMPLHTNFKLSAAGEDLFLVKGNTIIQHILPVNLATDETYSALPNGSNSFFVTQIPTPEEENEASLTVEFSIPSGFYTQNQDLTLALNASLGNIEIRYTTNGDKPTSTGILYENPIIIKDRSGEENYLAKIPTTPDYSNFTGEPTYPNWYAPTTKLAKGTVISVAAFHEGEQVGRVFTHTYFVFPEGKNRYTLPVLAITCPKDSLFGNKRGIYVPGESLEPDNIVWSGNYFEGGRDWERASIMEYFVEGESVINQTVGLRIHGGKTRGAAQKTLKIFARSSYGKKKMNYPFFKHKTQDSYKRLLLRTTMGSWHENIMQDAFAHQWAKGLRFDIQEYQPVIVFINGEYWGVHEMREKIDRYKIAADNNLDPDSIRIYGAWGGVIEGQGDLDFYAFRDDYLCENDITDPDVYEYVTTQLDIDNIIDYFFTEIFMHNEDWPSNNLRMWRSAQLDNKWRWLFFDLDGGFGGKRVDEENMIAILDDSEPYKGATEEWPTKIIRTLIKNETFKQKFIARAQFLLKNQFTADKVLPILAEMRAVYANELTAHFLRWENWLSVSAWSVNVDAHLKEYSLLRPCEIEKQMMDYFGIEAFLNCDNNAITAVNLYPNPVQNTLYLKVNSTIPTVYHCRIYNALGQEVYKRLVFSEDLVRLEMASFPKGMYHLCLYDFEEKKALGRKIIKM